jgi:hypothetical protein
VRLSRPRVLLRVVLLLVGGGYMLVRAAELYRSGRAAGDPAAATLSGRLALVWGLMGLLALLTAASAAWSLRRRRPRKTLRLDDVPRTPGPPPRA